MSERTVHGALDLQVVSDPEELKRNPGGRPFLRIKTPDGIVLELTLGMAVTIGAMAAGIIDYLEAIEGEPPAGRA